MESLYGTRIYCVSDLHTDYSENMAWVKGVTGDKEGCLVIAGDISHSAAQLEETLSYLVPKYASVHFVPGNHDLWVNSDDKDVFDSLEKLRVVQGICERLGVWTQPRMFGSVCVVPIYSWYDTPPSPNTLWIPAPGLFSDDERLWTDYHMCKWPSQLPKDRITKYFAQLNRLAQDSVEPGVPVVTFSHFLTHDEELDRSLGTSAYRLSQKRVMTYTGTFPNFSLVAGSSLFAPQIAALSPCVHVFAHSHRKASYMSDVLPGTQFVNNPLGYPKERSSGKITQFTEPMKI